MHALIRFCTLMDALQGVTGFGSAILNLCCWIALVVAGADSGKHPALTRASLGSTWYMQSGQHHHAPRRLGSAAVTQ
jgi:hypothetical protein